MAPAWALQVTVVVVVAVVARLLSIEPESLGEYALFIGPMEPVIVASTVHLGTKQGPGSRFLRPPHQIMPPTFSR